MNSFVGLIIMVGGLIAIRLLAERFLTNTSKKSRLFILVYVGILLLSLPVSYIISANQEREDPRKLLDQGIEASSALKQAIHEGRLPEAEHYRELEHWNIPYEGNRLNISSSGQSDAMVLVGRQQHSGEDIQITYYTTPHVYDDIDYTHLVHPPDVLLANNNLFISPSSTSLNLSFVGIRKDYYIAHFTEEETDSGRAHVRGQGFLYVEVPPELEIEATDDISLIFIED